MIRSLHGKAYGGADPELIEDDIFRIIIRYPRHNHLPRAPDNCQNHRPGTSCNEA
ncbi:MAG: hypothetical protein GQF41_2364 [Candidatus Rifleibacterium amylolyticum]|nr:MAG: hypothetical protein GQF41_2364 [Candidatus Rifleibacterium amylolyticum]